MAEACAKPAAAQALKRATAPLCFKSDGDKAGPGAGVLSKDKARLEQEQEKVLRCRSCDFTITTVKQGVSRDGKHRHTFFNPAGIVYEIGCFSDAPGCLIHGHRSREFTWFKGYSWQVVYCSNCTEHLGWYFSTAGSGFFGLLLNRLRQG